MATILSAATGNWNTGGTWVGGVVPGLLDHPVIQSGHNITLDIDPNTAGGEVLAGGILTFPPASSRKLTSTVVYVGVTPDWLGTLGNWIVRGTIRSRPASAAVVHEIEFVGVIEDRFVGSGVVPLDPDITLWVVDAGKCEISGTSKKAWTELTGSALAGATTISVPDVTGWNVADEIVVCPTREEAPNVPDCKNFEERKIKAIAGSGPYTVTLGSMADYTVTDALDFDHPEITWPTDFTSHPTWPSLVPVRAAVGNLTRNVVIKGAPTGRAGGIFIRNTTPVVQEFNYVEINETGPRKPDPSRAGWFLLVTGRWTFHLHDSGYNNDGSVFTGLVTKRAMAHAYVQHMSHGTELVDCVAYDGMQGAFWWDNKDITRHTHWTNCLAAKTSSEVYGERGFGVFAMGLTRDEENPERPSSVTGCRVVGQYATPGKTITANAAAFKWSESHSGFWSTFDDNTAQNCEKEAIDWWTNRPLPDPIKRFRAVRVQNGFRIGAYGGSQHFEDCAFYKIIGNGTNTGIAYEQLANSEISPTIKNFFIAEATLGFEESHHVQSWQTQFVVEGVHMWDVDKAVEYTEMDTGGIGSAPQASNVRWKESTHEGAPLELADFDLALMHEDSILVIEDAPGPPPVLTPDHRGIGHSPAGSGPTAVNVVLRLIDIVPAPVAGDLIFGFVFIRASDPILTVPADWRYFTGMWAGSLSVTEPDPGSLPGGTSRAVWSYYHYLTQAEVDAEIASPGSVTWTWVKTTTLSGSVVGHAISNPHPFDPIDEPQASRWGTPSDLTTSRALQLRARYTNMLAVSVHITGVTTTFTPDAAVTERLDSSDTVGSIEVCTELFPVGHHIPDRISTQGVASRNAAIMFGVKSPSSVEVPTPTDASLVQEKSAASDSSIGGTPVVDPTLLTSSYDTDSQADYVTASISPTANRWLVVDVFYNVDSTVSLAGLGLTWIQEANTTDGSALRIARFYAWTGATPGSGAITITPGAGAAACGWIVYELGADVDTSDPFVQSVATTVVGSDTSVTATLAAFGAANNRPLVCAYHGTNEASTPESGYTEIGDINGAAPNSGFASAFHPSATDTSPSYSWATSTGGRRVIASEIKAAVLAGVPPSVTLDADPKHGNTLIIDLAVAGNAVPAYHPEAVLIDQANGDGIDVYRYIVHVLPGPMEGTGHQRTWAFTLTPDTGPWALYVRESAGVWENANWDRKARNNSAAAAVAALATGTTAETHQADEVLFPSVAINHNVPGTVGWDGIPGADDAQVSAPTGALTLAVARREVAALGTFAHTASWTTAAKAAALITTFRIGKNPVTDFFHDDYNRGAENLEDSGDYGVYEGGFLVDNNEAESTAPGGDDDNLVVTNKRIVLPQRSVSVVQKQSVVEAGRAALMLAMVERGATFGHAQSGDSDAGMLSGYSFRWSQSGGGAFRIARHIRGWMKSMYDFVEAEPAVPYSLELRITINDDGSTLLQGYSGGVLKVQGTDDMLLRHVGGDYLGMELKTIHIFDDFGMSTSSVVFLVTAESNEAAQPFTVIQPTLVGTALETDTAQPLVSSQSRALVTALETDVAQVMASHQARALVTAPVLESAQVLVPSQSRALATTLELDTAQPITVVIGGPLTPSPIVKASRYAPILKADEWFIGADASLEFTLKDRDGSIPNITGWGLEWVLRLRPYSASATLTKTTASGIQILDGPNGRCRVDITDDDTLALYPARYFHTLKRTDANGEGVYVYGDAVLRQSAAR